MVGFKETQHKHLRLFPLFIENNFKPKIFNQKLEKEEKFIHVLAIRITQVI
jgi:hypothetical protein